MQNAKDDGFIKGLIAFGVFYVVWFICGVSALFFWVYAWFTLLKDSRVLEAAAAFVVMPIGAIYGFLRFFNLL